LLIILKKKKKNHFLKNFYFLINKIFLLKNLKKIEIKKISILNYYIFKYYFNYTNLLNTFFKKNINSGKNILILINFKKSQPFFSIIDLKKKTTKITFSFFTILKLIKITKKNLKKANKNLPIIFNFLKKNILKNLNATNFICVFKII
jgi:hypothetical protein